VTAPNTLPEYREALQALLDGPQQRLSDAELLACRAIVREQRRGRAATTSTEAAAGVHAQADAIVRLLDAAARELRPRETQELEDIVAGRAAPAAIEAPRYAVRPRRSGWPSR
jgi:hypothetical protein